MDSIVAEGNFFAEILNALTGPTKKRLVRELARAFAYLKGVLVDSSLFGKLSEQIRMDHEEEGSQSCLELVRAQRTANLMIEDRLDRLRPRQNIVLKAESDDNQCRQAQPVVDRPLTIFWHRTALPFDTEPVQKILIFNCESANFGTAMFTFCSAVCRSTSEVLSRTLA